MTREQANKIKKILKKESAVFTDTAGYFDGNELRVKVVEFLEYSKIYDGEITKVPNEKKEKTTMENSIKILRALEKNGLRPQYKKEQRETQNAVGKYDCRYLIFR